MQPAVYAIAILLSAYPAFADDHDPLTFRVDGDRFVASGEVDGDSQDRFLDLHRDYPAIRTLVLQSIGGSVDDEANLALGRTVRDLGFVTVVPAGGLVSSGGTDLFLAGVRRVLEPGACVGVHAWAGDDYTALDVPRSDPEHAPYLDYYADLGIDASFYWFTLSAAPADGMHWMSPGEADRLGVATTVVPSLGSGADCDDR